MIRTRIEDAMALVAKGALVVVNHSGGKDSQAQLIELAKIIPTSQLLVVHASLGDIEWAGALEHAKAGADALGVPFIVAHAFRKDGSEKTLLGMVEDRKAQKPSVPSWPSKTARYCTSDLKRDPIAREIRRYVAKTGHKLIINCEGIRASESADRAKKNPWSLNTRLSEAGRVVYDWFPIFDLSTDDVFAVIRDAGQKPHWAYEAGNERLSCVFCVFASASDLKNGAKHRPDLYRRYVEMEEKTGYTMHVSQKSLRELVEDAVELAA